MGNVDFEETAGDQAVVTETETLAFVAELLRVDPDILSNAITMRVMETTKACGVVRGLLRVGDCLC